MGESITSGSAVSARHKRPVGTTRAVILARGLGTRMRKADASAPLDPAQSLAADSGMKGMIPIGRPFMDYLISALADAHFTDVCLIIGPEHQAVRDYYALAASTRIRIHFAIQEQPRGTADAVLAAERFASGQSFVVINSDNYYPVSALAELQRRNTLSLIAFERSALVHFGNVPPDRVERFGVLEIDDEGRLRRILAMPTEAMQRSPELYASLNCWLFTADIFRACRSVRPSARGELELPQAVQLAIDEQGAQFEAVRVRAPVLDMSSRADIASVAEHLAGVRVLL